MRWEDERYVRVYTRDTPDWLCLSFLAQGLFCLILRKVDRAGLLKLGKHGRRAVAIVIGFPGDWTRLEPALDELIADGCIQIRGEHLVIPNFIEAQEATQSDAQRKRESRARSRDIAAAAEVLNPDKTSESVTDGHENGQKVTSGHNASQVVTPNCAVPSLAVPDLPSGARPRARLISGLGAADPHPEISAVLAALWERGHDAAAPADKSAGRVKAAIIEATIPVAVERLSAVYARPGSEKPLTYHVDAIRGLTAPTGKPPPLAPPSLDADWLEGIPEDERGRARVAWAEIVERVKRSAYPDAFPRLVAEAKEQFQATWQAEEASA